ncbi:MAG: hypothetical protein LW816_19450 [Planctomyces sp.]|nr:hypothetical protein [Planctomyces sp.]
MPLLALMSVRRKDPQILERIGKAPWKFRTKLELTAGLVDWCVTLFKSWFRKRLMVDADGAYAKRPFLKRLKATENVLATHAPADGVIRVVIVKRSVELFSDCSAIEQNFHDV